MTIGTRLTLVVVALFAVFAGVFAQLGARAADRYFQDVTQELSAPIAMYIAEQRAPFHAGTFDAAKFQSLAETAMILNPAMELYALDASGRVVAAGASKRPLLRHQLDLQPFQRFMANAQDRPLLGDDPRSPTARRIFSVAAVGPSASPYGYIYAVLDSSARRQLSQQSLPGYLWALAGGGGALILLAGVAVTSLLYARITRPLRSLAAEMARFEAEAPLPTRASSLSTGDEIARLESGFAGLRARIAAQMQALHSSDTARREWIAHLSHDLRTPLAKLQGHLETALRRDGTATSSERRESLARALLHSSETRGLLDELFESARLEAPTLELHRECFSLAELAQDTVLGLRGAAAARHVRIEYACTAADTSVVADVSLVQRLIDNLLTNAVKASQPHVSVELNVQRVDDWVELSVADRGPGPTEDMIRVFNLGREPAAGTGGLGLRIVAQILRLHGMRAITLGGPSGGTVVRVSMPAADGTLLLASPLNDNESNAAENRR